jgi:cytoskeletal protein RodZ
MYIYITTVLAALTTAKASTKHMASGPNFLYFTTFSWEFFFLQMQHWKGKYQSLPVSISSSPTTICKNRRCSSEPPSEQETRVAMASEACASPSFSATTTTTTTMTMTQKRTQNNEFADEIFTPVLFFVSTACKKTNGHFLMFYFQLSLVFYLNLKIKF